jgi:multiple sugar transport system permease protein
MSLAVWILGLARRLSLGALALVAAGLVAWAFIHVGIRDFVGREDAGDGITLTVLHWSGDGGQEEDAIVEESLARFEAANPGVRVRRINPGDAGSFYTKLQTMMASGEPPDVFYMGFERLGSFAKLGLLASLEPFLEAEKSQADALDLDAFYPQTVKAFRFDGARVGTGPLYGIPKDFTTVGFYINKDLFAKAGVPLPKDGWTWDEYLAAARALGKLEGVTGSEFVTWPVMVRTYLRTEGAEVIADDLDSIRIDEPATLAALERLRSWRHDETGTLTSGKSKIATGPSVFLGGKVGMAGPFGRWVTPSYRTIPNSPEKGGFAWDFVPLPRGSREANCVLTVSWSIASASPHQDAAWKLVKWLTSAESQAANARLGLAIPTLKAVAESDAFSDPTQEPANDRGFLDAIPEAEVIEWPVDQAFEQILGNTLESGLNSGDLTVPQAVEQFQRLWREHLRYRPGGNDPPALPWRGLGVAGLAMLGALGLWFATLWLRAPASAAVQREERAGWLFASPWVLGFLAFMAVPIVVSAAISLSDWKGIGPLGEARWVGSDNYAHLLVHDSRFRTSLWVTVYYAILAVPGGQILALLAAMLLNTRVFGVALFRAAWYLPSVLAGVGVAILWRWIFDAQDGLLNGLLREPLSLVGLAPPEWFGKDAATFGPPAFALMSLWLVGGSMMVYLAGLQQVPKDLHEAAAIDGAGPWQRFTRVTLPMLSPVILFNVIMAVIGSFQVFTQAFVMTGGTPGDLTRFYVLYLYNKAFESYEMGYASAMAWVLLAIVLVLTGVLLRSSARVVYYEALRK